MSIGLEGYNFPAGIAYIALPTDLSRDEYISICYRTCSVSIRTEDGGFYNRVPIGRIALDFVEFPSEPSKLGSPVVFVNEPIKNHLLIVDIYESGDSIQDGKEGQFKFRKRWGENYVEIAGSAKDKFVGVTVNTKEKGEFYVNVSNKNKDAKIRLQVLGDVELSASNNIGVVAYKKFSVKTISPDDEKTLSSFEQTSDENLFDGKKFKINKGDQAMVRGDKIKDLLNDFFSDLSSAKVMTSDGPMPFTPDFIAKMEVYKGKLSDILSSKSFLE